MRNAKTKRNRKRNRIHSDESPSKLLIQSDRIHLFDKIKIQACEETCNVQDIVSKVELNAHGLDSGCNLEQCCMYCKGN